MLRRAFALLLSTTAAACVTGPPEPTDPTEHTEPDIDTASDELSGLPVQPRSWSVVLRDEFNGTTLDRTKWDTKFAWGGRTLPANEERQCYVDSNVAVANGRLVLTATRANVACDGNPNAYASGMVSAHRAMAQKYGYFEMRAKLPRGQGLWPAFWTLPNLGSQVPYQEIDVMELRGHEPTRAYMNVHWSVNGVRRDLSSSYAYPDFTADFHTFAVRWKQGSIAWFIDGVEQKRFDGSHAPFVPNQNMYLIANLAVGGKWPRDPDATTTLPARMEIDYIRALEFHPGPESNVLGDGGFEGTTAIGPLPRPAWSSFGRTSLSPLPRSGRFAGRLDGMAGFEQVVTGLRPLTVYRLTGYVRSLSGTETMIGVKDHGGPQQFVHTSWGTAWARRDVTFMTGDTTTAKIFVYQPSGASLADDLTLTVLD